MPLTPEWSNFFTAELGALAALTGFVVVAISINLSRILANPSLPSRAAEALVGPVGAIAATGLMLLPEQPAALVGAEVLVIGLVMVAAPLTIQLRTWSDRKDATPIERLLRFANSAGYSLAFVVGGALLVAGARAGLFWVGAGEVACLVAVMVNAWVLMVEILR
jgi:modulator of FtsH protease